MPGLEDLHSAIDRLEKAEARCREASSEANSSAKALQVLIREVKQIVHDQAEDIIDKAVKREVKEMEQTVELAISQAVDKVAAEFDKLAKIYLQGDSSDPITVHDLAKEVRSRQRKRRGGKR